MSTLIYVRGRVVGSVQGFNFVKVLNRERHFIHKPPAIALDCKSLADAKRAGALNVAVKTETGEWFIACTELVELKGFKFNRDHGDQIALRLHHWRPTVNQARQYYDELTHPQPKAEPQLSLSYG